MIYVDLWEPSLQIRAYDNCAGELFYATFKCGIGKDSDPTPTVYFWLSGRSSIRNHITQLRVLKNVGLVCWS